MTNEQEDQPKMTTTTTMTKKKRRRRVTWLCVRAPGKGEAGLRTGCSKWREWTETTGWQVTPGKPRPTGGTYAGEEEGGRLGGYANQPASRRDSQLGRPTWGVSLRPQGPQERRAVSEWRGTVGRRTAAAAAAAAAAAGERWVVARGTGRGDFAGPRGNAAVWWDPPVRRVGREGKKVGETRRDPVCRVWLSSEWANRPTAHSTNAAPPNAHAVYGVHAYAYRAIQKWRYTSSRDFFRYRRCPSVLLNRKSHDQWCDQWRRTNCMLIRWIATSSEHRLDDRAFPRRECTIFAKIQSNTSNASPERSNFCVATRKHIFFFAQLL